MGRRWGKTTMAGSLAVSYANHGAKVGWAAPTYKNSRPLWRFAERAILQAGNAVDKNKTERTLTFKRTGGWLGIYSADNDVGIRGEDFDLFIMEEAAKIRASTFYDVILPTLADRDGIAMLISTPAGRNWFWREAVRAQNDTSGLSLFKTAPSKHNPNPKIQKAYELAKTRVPLSTFRQEWDAEFLEGEGSVFSRINQAATVQPNAQGIFNIQPYLGHFVAGLDLAQKRDYTVMVVMDAEKRQQVDILRINRVSWQSIRTLIQQMVIKWGIRTILGEANSIGGPNIESLQDAGVNVIPFDTTSSSKGPLIQSLVLAFEQDEIKIFNDPEMKLELEAYEKHINPITGRVTYSAPEGEDNDETGEEIHDDYVIALALAWRTITFGATSELDEDATNILFRGYA